MRYRKAEQADVPMLAAINQRLIDDEWGGGGMSRARLEERIHGWIEDDAYRALLFSEDGSDVAYALVSVDGESAYIRHFFVMDEHRGGGAGRRALDLLIRDIIPPATRVTLDVLASNTGGHAFWRSVGFTDYAIRMERVLQRPVL